MGRVSDAKERLLEAVRELIWTGSYGSTTIDQICEKAGVKKGSFYYFFDSKAGLAGASLDLELAMKRPLWDGMFSASVPPLERLERLCEYLYEEQREKQLQFGHVLGCPLFALGSEVCTLEAGLRDKIQDIFNLWVKYLEAAVRDAHAAGVATASDAKATAQVLFAYSEGMMTQARIQDDLQVLKSMYAGVLQILGATMPTKIAA